MDGQRFDCLARAVGSGLSRRSVVKGMGIAVLAAVAGRRIPAAAAQQCIATGEHCGVDVQCCSGLCSGAGVCFEAEEICSEVGEACGFSEDRLQFFNCCEGLHCDAVVCQPPQYICAAEGEACGGIGGDGLTPCCGDLTCADNICIVGEVTELPSTGARPNDNSSWITPVAAGAVTAAVIGKIVKSSGSTKQSE